MPKLHELKHKKSLLVAEAKALARKEEDLPDGEQLPAEDIGRLDQIQTEVNVLSGSIDRLQAIVDMEAGSADPVDPGPGGDKTAPMTEEERAARDMQLRRYSGRATGFGHGERRSASDERGFKIARYMIGLWHAQKGMGLERAAAFVERRFGDKEVAKALNTSGTATGGALIPQDFIPDLIELLRAATTVRGFDPLIVPMPMGNATIPRLAGGAQAGYQGELDDMTTSQETFDDLQLNAKKLTAIVPVSNDLIRRAPIGVEAIVRDDLVQTVARREDLAFLMGDGSGNSPIGFLNLCAASNKLLGGTLPTDPTQANYNTTIASYVAALLEGMTLALEQGMSRMIRPGWIMAPATKNFLRTIRDGVGNFIYRDEISQGTLLGYPFKTTAQLATNVNTAQSGNPTNNGAYLFLADFADVIIGETYSVNVDVSAEATYKDGGGNVVSAFQRDQTLFRVISEHDFNIRHQASLAVAVLPGWTSLGYSPIAGQAYYVQAASGDGSAAPSTWGTPPTGSNNPANSAAVAPGGTLPGRP